MTRCLQGLPLGRPFFCAARFRKKALVAESILQRIAAGDATAVDDCLRQYRGLVWSLARRFSTDPSELEDALQEVFIDLWRCAERYDETAGSEPTFITTVARRRLIDRNRKRSRRIETSSMAMEDVRAEASANHSLELAEEAAQAQLALQQLRAEERQVLELSIYQGLSQSKIAEATQMPLGSVKTHTRRGLVRLREMLSDPTASATSRNTR